MLKNRNPAPNSDIVARETVRAIAGVWVGLWGLVGGSWIVSGALDSFERGYVEVGVKGLLEFTLLGIFALPGVIFLLLTHKR